jgi:hypothetical protein
MNLLVTSCVLFCFSSVTNAASIESSKVDWFPLLLKQSVKEKSVNTPAQALDFLNANVVATLNQHTTDAPVRDGMDISLVAIEFATKKLQYAGANNPIYILRNKELIVLKPDKQAIGSVSEELKAFTNHEFDLQTGDLIYMFTDGYADQFGGPDGKKLKPKTKTKVNREKIPIAIQESLLPNPLMIYFIGGIHFTKEGMTTPGKKLLEHFLSQRGWEVSIISRGGHIEVCPYVNPDGTIARFGGNTGGGTTVSRDGGKFAAKPNSIWNFSAGAKAGTYVVFTKVVPKGGSQKIEPTMNGVFRRTPIVDSYYRSINNKTILPTLKNTLYDQIVERE